MFVAPVITEGQEDRAAGSCSGPSQTAILGKTGPALTRCSTQENGPSTSPEQSRAEQDGPEGVRGESWSPPSAMWWRGEKDAPRSATCGKWESWPSGHESGRAQSQWHRAGLCGLLAAWDSSPLLLIFKELVYHFLCTSRTKTESVPFLTVLFSYCR